MRDIFPVAFTPVAESRAMSDRLITPLDAAFSSDHPHDLLACLYREIGLSAVAAALDVMIRPEPEAAEETRLPAILEEQLAA